MNGISRQEFRKGVIDMGQDLQVHILGISGSPRDGNTRIMVEESLNAAETIGDVTTTLIRLDKKQVKPCIDCGRCPVSEERFCALKDDMEEIYLKLIKADGIIIGAPTYFGNVNAQIKALMDRCRPLGRAGMLMQHKIGGAIAVGACRNGGQEKVLSTIIDYFVLCGVLPVGLTTSLQVGAVGMAWIAGKIRDDVFNNEALPEPESGLGQCRQIGRAVAVYSQIMKAGLTAIQKDVDSLLGGWKLPDSVH